jgi:hypothetical protein
MGESMETIPWYKAAIAQRLALAIVVHLIGLTPAAKYLVGLDLAPIINDLLEAAGTALDGWALHARATKPVPPIALTQAKADAANVSTTPDKGNANAQITPVAPAPVPPAA